MYNGFDQPVWESQWDYLQEKEEWRQVISRQWAYYASGEIDASWEGSTANVTDYRYETDGANIGRLHAIVRGIGISDATGVFTPHQTTMLGYDTYGRVRTTTVDGFTTTQSYDTLDRVIRRDHPDGSSQTFTYFPGGAVQREGITHVGQAESIIWHEVDSLGREYYTLTPDGGVRTYYDAFDRPIKVTDNRLTMNGSETDRSTYLTYDTAGNLIKKLDPALVTASGPYTDARRPYAEYGYDQLDRQTVAGTLMYGATISPQNMSFVANAAGAWTTTEYDVFDRPVKTKDADGYETQLTYDNSNNVTSVKRQVWKGDEPGKASAYTGFDWVTTRTAYDGLGRAVQQVDGRGNSKRTTYSSFGPQSQVDERDVVTQVFTYTADGLLSGVWEPDNNPGTTAARGSVDLWSPGGTHTRTEYREYDTRPLPARIYRAYMNTAAGPDTGGARTDYVYNAQGKPTQTTLPPDQNGARAVVTQSYDDFGNPLTSTDANGFLTSFAYNWAGKLIEKHEHARGGNATDSNAGLAAGLHASYRYDAAGNLKYKNERGLIVEYKSNSLGKMISESRPRVGEGTGTNWKHRTYRLDGPMTAETSYDYVGSLTSAPDITDSSDSRMTLSAGNITFKWYYARGIQIGEVSYGPNKSWEYTRHTFVNGLGNRYFRQFWGNQNIYKLQQYANGASTGYTHYLSFWKFDANSNLSESWDTPGNAANDAPLDSTLKQNTFTYTYSPTNKEIAQTRNIQVRYQSTVTTNALYSSYGGNRGVILGSSIATSSASYNERDQLLRTDVTDQSPTVTGSATSPSPQDQIGNSVTKHNRYSYFQDGRRENSWTGNGSTDTGYKGVESYDQRGRELQVYDSTGGRTNGAPARTNTTYAADGTITNVVTQGSEVYRSVMTSTVGGVTASDVSTRDGVTSTSTSIFTSGSSLTGVPYTTTQSSTAAGNTPSTSTNTYDVYGNLIQTQGQNPDTQAAASVYQASYNLNGSATFESKLSRVNEDSPYVYQTSTYTLDSRGNRLNVSGGEASGYVKRYDADGRVTQFHNLNIGAVSTTFCNNSQGQCYGVGNRYNDFRYDPFGQQVLSSTGQIEEQNSTDTRYQNEHGIWRDMNSTHMIEGETQFVLRRAGAYIWKYVHEGLMDSRSSFRLFSDTYNSYGLQTRDATYSLADGYSDDTAWTGTRPFAIPQAGVEALDAPIKPLSSVLNINPLEVNTGSLSSINLPDPSQIKAGDVQAKDAPVKADPKSSQNVKAAPEGKVDVRLETGGPAQGKTDGPLSGTVLTQEVPAHFDDGQGFRSAVYAQSSSQQVYSGEDSPSKPTSPSGNTENTGLQKEKDIDGGSKGKPTKSVAAPQPEFTAGVEHEIGKAKLSGKAPDTAARNTKSSETKANVDKNVKDIFAQHGETYVPRASVTPTKANAMVEETAHTILGNDYTMPTAPNSSSIVTSTNDVENDPSLPSSPPVYYSSPPSMRNGSDALITDGGCLRDCPGRDGKSYSPAQYIPQERGSVARAFPWVNGNMEGYGRSFSSVITNSNASPALLGAPYSPGRNDARSAARAGYQNIPYPAAPPYSNRSTASAAGNSFLPRTANQISGAGKIAQAPAPANGKGTQILLPKDPFYPAEKGWVKMEQTLPINGERIKYHWMYNKVTGQYDDIKVKVP